MPPIDASSSPLVAEARKILVLATPVAIWSLGLMLMGFVDVLVAGRIDSTQLAAVSLGHLFSYSVLAFAFGTLRGLDPFVSQAFGAGDTPGIARALGRLLLLATALTLPALLLHAYAAPILLWLDQPREIVPITASYCQALLPGLLPALLFAALSQFLQSLGQMWRPMIVILLANLINLALDLVFVLGAPSLGIPALGAEGCGIATSIGRWFMVAATIILCFKTLRQYRPASLADVLEPRANLQVLAIGLPVGFQACLEGWAFSALGLMMGWLGATALAAHAITINLAALAYMLPSGIGVAASTRVGHLIGAKDPHWPRAAWVAIGFSLLVMLLSASLFYFLRFPIASLYTSDEAVLVMVGSLLPIVAAFQIFDGLQATTFGALRGAGDTFLPALANVIGYWIVGLPLGYWVGISLGYGPRALWATIALSLGIIATLLLLRLLMLIRRGVGRVSDHQEDDPDSAARHTAELLS